MFKFNGNSPFRDIAVNMIAISAESTVDRTETPDAGGIQTLQSSDPEFKIGINRIFDKNGNVITKRGRQRSKKIRYILDRKRIGHSSRTYPYRIYTGTQDTAQMGRRGDFRHRNHSCLVADFSKPWQRTRTYAFE